MRKAFLDFLIRQGVVGAEAAVIINTRLRVAPEPIGAIAFRYGMLNAGDIDAILAEQRQSHRQFGQIAVELGLLNAEQVETLLCVQQVRTTVETAEALALSGTRAVDDVMVQLGRFLAQARVSQLV